MEAFTYLQINLIPILALIIMRVNAEHTLSYLWRNRALRFMMVLLSAIMFVNLVALLLDGQTFAGARQMLWICNTAYYAIFEFLTYLWYLYVQDILENGMGQRGKYVLKPAIPLLFFLLVLITNPWTRLIFYIDEKNCYVRGNGIIIHVIISMGYVIVASIRALYACRKEEQEERRKELRWLVYFMILPMVGGILQMKFEGLDLMLPLTADSLLMVYINVQQKKVTRDALTGLNNRGRLEQYLVELEEQSFGDENCHLLLLDVDRFKQINDTFGHIAGDSVLKLVADQLKKVFGNSRSFIARYGGDEFVIILRGKTDEEVKADMDMLRDGITKMSWGDETPWALSVSAGVARYGEIPMQSVKELVNLADERMYDAKKRNK